MSINVEKILVTGASGFVGSAVAAKLIDDYQLISVVRKGASKEKIPGQVMSINGLENDVDFSEALADIDVVIHIAAKAHNTSVEESEYYKVNVEGTLNLARQAARCGVKRFIFLSSIGVNGSENQKPFTEADEPQPSELYAESKWRAEQGLWDISEQYNLDVVIIRPPLVYGPNAPGNFGRLVRLAQKGIPLPLGNIKNQRSFIALDNLVDLIATCVEHPDASNQLFVAGDGCDVSTTDLLLGLSRAMGKSLYLIPLPANLLMFFMSAVGKEKMARQLLGSLRVDISKARSLLGWEPPVSFEEGLKRCFK
ncbi:NAD-dependent epimerase/dehydratase family protein [Neptuniibacter sp. QD57_21]|uniref:NAD-dependent epimerase/dehydratase family protein n=1 Tax=Neptuniibacter sp. QD57_21 TaxID=3398213 RepID=UPI0039F4C885